MCEGLLADRQGRQIRRLHTRPWRMPPETKTKTELGRWTHLGARPSLVILATERTRQEKTSTGQAGRAGHRGAGGQTFPLSQTRWQPCCSHHAARNGWEHGPVQVDVQSLRQWSRQERAARPSRPRRGKQYTGGWFGSRNRRHGGNRKVSLTRNAAWDWQTDQSARTKSCSTTAA